jgi:hypothetical protein
MQGYYFARPMPAEECLQAMIEDRRLAELAIPGVTLPLLREPRPAARRVRDIFRQFKEIERVKTQTFSYTAGAWSAAPEGGLDSGRTLVVLFGASGLIDNPAPLERVIEAYPRSTIMAVPALARFTAPASTTTAWRSRSRSSSARRCASRASGLEEAAIRTQPAKRWAGSSMPPISAPCCCSPDGLQVNGSELVRGVNAVLPPQVTVTGGLAGDGDRFRARG